MSDLDLAYDLATVYAAPSVLDGARDKEFTRDEWLAWHDEEFAGIDPDALAWDALGEINVDPYQLAQDRDVIAHLNRVEAHAELVGPDGSMTIRGANPFSTDEGAAEWLARVRSELRCEYRKARSESERRAIVAREAALRARHNARCFGRAVARYYRVDETASLTFLDGWQKDNPIGWLGLEAAMRSMFEGCERDYFEARERWDSEFRPHWDDEEKDEWLARMPEPPQYPTSLVSSVKKLRRDEVKTTRVTAVHETHETQIVEGRAVTTTRQRRSVWTAERWVDARHRENCLPRGDWEERWAKAHPQPVAQLQPRAGTEVAVGAGLTPGQARFYAREAERTTEWFDLRREWERAELLTPIRLEVPESLDFSGPGELDDVPAFVPSSFQPLHRCGERCLICNAVAA